MLIPRSNKNTTAKIKVMNLNSALRKKIVIVEDNEDLRNSYSLIINNSGSYEVIGAYGTGEEAIEKVQKRVPDIILMDIELPGINGSETTRRILERNHLIQFVYTSGLLT